MAEQTPRGAEERRREIIARVTRSEAVMAQHRASRASFERGEPAIPADQVWTDEEDRSERASR